MIAENSQRRLHELRQQIIELGELSQDDSHEWSDQNETDWKRLNKEFDACQRDLQFQRAENMRNPQPMFGREDKVGNGGLLDGQQHVTHQGESYRDTFTGRLVPVVRKGESFTNAVISSRGGVNPQEDYQGLSLGRMLRALVTGTENDAERRALSEGTDSAGGYTVPSFLSSQVIDLMRVKSRVMQAGAGMIELTSDKNSFAKLLTDPSPSWRSESSSVGESDPTFGQITFAPKSLAVLVKVSRELLEDSVNVEQSLNNSLAQSLANEVDRVCLVGTGASGEPQGMAYMANGINEHSMGANGAAVADFTDLLDAIKLLQDDNAGGVSAAIMNPRTLRVYSGLEDSTGQPLRRPFTIESLPFLETSQIPIDQVQGSASDASSIYLGDFADLIIGMRSRLQVEILKERYADTLSVGFLAHMRLDVHAWHEQSLARIVGIIPS